MRISLVLLIVGATLVTCLSSNQVKNSPNDLLLAEWEEFKTNHGKVYESKLEDAMRFNIYLERRNSVDKHNQEYSNGPVTYREELNKFADMTTKELIGGYDENETIKKASNEEEQPTIVPGKDLPPFDWRSKGMVTPVEDQGKCNSGWAFAGVGALESSYGMNSGTQFSLTQLSKQQLIDCAKGQYSMQGCRSGSAMDVLYYLRDNGGINTEIEYPYKGQEGDQCHFNPSTATAKLTAVVRSGPFEDFMQENIYNFGPASAAIGLSDSFYLYKDGVFSDPKCTGHSKHHVLIVGWGSDPQQGDFWIIKNSWSSKWGENGYMRLARNKKMCNIQEQVYMASFDPSPFPPQIRGRHIE